MIACVRLKEVFFLTILPLSLLYWFRQGFKWFFYSKNQLVMKLEAAVKLNAMFRFYWPALPKYFMRVFVIIIEMSYK